MGQSSETSTTTSGSSNPNVTKSLDQLMAQFQSAISAGAPKVYGQSLYTGPGQMTQNAWQSAYGASQNPAFQSGMNNAFNYNNSLLSGGGLTGGQGYGQGGGWENYAQSNMGPRGLPGGAGQPQQGQGGPQLGNMPRDPPGGGPQAGQPYPQGQTQGQPQTQGGVPAGYPTPETWDGHSPIPRGGDPRGRMNQQFQGGIPTNMGPESFGGQQGGIGQYASLFSGGNPGKPMNNPNAPGGGGQQAPGQWGNVQNTEQLSQLLQGMGQNGGLNEAQTGALNDTQNLSDRLGGLAGQYGAPGIMERNLGGVAGGQYLRGANPYFEKNLGTALDQAGAGVNAAVGAGGRFGSGAHVNQLGTTLGNLSNSARGQQYETERDRQMQANQGIAGERATNRGLQLGALGQQGNALGQAFGMGQTGMGNQFNAYNSALAGQGQSFGMQQQGVQNSMNSQNQLGNLFQQSLMPSQVMGGIGSSIDQGTQAERLADANRWNANQNNNLNWLSSLSSIFGGTAPYGGTQTSTTSPSTPWWQTALSLGGQFL